jgi:hypothetical protein
MLDCSADESGLLFVRFEDTGYPFADPLRHSAQIRDETIQRTKHTRLNDMATRAVEIFTWVEGGRDDVTRRGQLAFGHTRDDDRHISISYTEDENGKTVLDATCKERENNGVKQ